jgi:hypothetical protein
MFQKTIRSGSVAGDITKSKYQVPRETLEFRIMNDPRDLFTGFFGRLKEQEDSFSKFGTR